MMDNVINNMRKGLLKRQEAMAKHHARKEEFVNKRERIIQYIEEVRTIWIKTMEQLPKTEFQEF
jgi:coenzyme F420-reducing hydrogenase alpha subunit